MSQREKHNAYMREKIECECGIITSRVNINRHRQTVQHIKIVDRDAYIRIISEKFDKKIRKLTREKKLALKHIDKEIVESIVNNR